MEPTDLVGPVVVHSQGTIIYANGTFRELIDADTDTEIAGRSLDEFVSPSDRDALREQFTSVADGENTTLGLSVTLETPTGVERDVVTVTSPVEWDGTTRLHTTFVELGTMGQRDGVALREAAMHEAPVGITIADATRDDEPLIYVNDEFVELTGYRREEVLGRNCRFLQGEKTREESVAQMREAIDARKPVTVDIRNYRKDGTMFWNRITITPVRDETGNVTHFLGFQEDISETKVYEHEKSLFQKHAEASDQVMIVTNREGEIEYVNPAFERVTGYTAEEVLGENPRLLKSEEQNEEFYQELWETITADETWESELTNRTKSGELYRVKQTIIPITDDRGEITHFAAIERNITEERITTQVIDVLDRVLRHNVRTSVNVIDGFASVLEDELEGTDHRAAVQAIRERSAALREISEQTTAIRDLIRGGDDGQPLALSDLPTIIERCQNEFDDATITLEMDADTDRAIQNGAVFQMALEEAIENAVIHNEQETPTVEVTVTDTDAHETRIEIVDNGPPIPQSEWSVIKTGKETPLVHSQGLGLWVMYWAATALGGQVHHRERDPRGNIITFELPTAVDPADSAPEDS